MLVGDTWLVKTGGQKFQYWPVSLAGSMGRLPDNLRQRAIGQIQAGRSISDVARDLNVHKTTISRLWARFRTTNSVEDGQRSGRPKALTLRQQRATLRHHRQNPFDTAEETARQTVGTNNRPVSRQTVGRLLDYLHTFNTAVAFLLDVTVHVDGASRMWCCIHALYKLLLRCTS